MHLVALAAEAEFDVGTLAERVGVSIATASQHLSNLRLAGVISAHRNGRRQIYVVDDPHVLTLIDQIFEHIAPDGTLAPDPPVEPGGQAAQGAGLTGQNRHSMAVSSPSGPKPASSGVFVPLDRGQKAYVPWMIARPRVLNARLNDTTAAEASLSTPRDSSATACTT